MAERLEEIKNVYEDYKGLQKKRDFKQADIALLYLSENHIDWLIQQAERVEELEYAVRKIDVVIDHHRLIKQKEADELADCIVEIISDLEEKVGEIT